MNILQDILHDPVSLLSDELRNIDEQIRRAAQKNDVGTLEKLSERKSKLPELIRQAQLNSIGDRINDQRTKLEIFEMDLQKARQLVNTLGTGLTPKITALNQEIERLRDEAAQAMASREALQFAVSHEQRELERLKKQRENLLLSQYQN